MRRIMIVTREPFWSFYPYNENLCHCFIPLIILLIEVINTIKFSTMSGRVSTS